MTYPWAESTSTQEVATETTTGESPYGEAYPAGESEWGAPFAPSEAEAGSFEYGQEYGQETLSPDGTEAEWESPFATSSLASDSEIMRTPEQFPKTCGDTTFDGKPWPYGTKKPETVGGWASEIRFVPHAEVFVFGLAEFDVDRHELKAPHKKVIAELTQRVQAGIREGRYSGTDPIRVFTYGETSTTASGRHNAPLSRNRAFNTLHAVRCAFQAAGITHPTVYGFYGTGEQHARAYGPDNKEDARYRGVVVRVIAPLKDCNCEKPPTPTTGTSTLCVSVPRIAPRVATKLPPDVIPLNSVVPGLRLPIAIVTRAEATVRVDEQRTRQSGQYTFSGWGIEVALPAGRTRIDIRADLRASIEVLMRASASLGAKLRLGPLKLTLRVDVSVFAQLVAKLCAQLRIHIDANLGRPNLPELSQCRLVDVRGVRGAFPFGALAGPGLLVVPGAGYGPGLIHFGGPGVPGLQLSANPIPVPADKSTVKSLLVLGGNLALASGAGREAEYEMPEAEWPEAFAEVQSELAPY